MKLLLDSPCIKNNTLLIFGAGCFTGGIICLVLMAFCSTIILGVNAWLKPFKFFISIGVFAWTMAIYLHFMTDTFQVTVYSWALTALLSLELFFIVFQVARGRTSHFNTRTESDSAVAVLMGVVILIMMLHTCYVTILFFQQQNFNLGPVIVLAMKSGLLSMIIFAFEGFIMVSYLRHTIGHNDGCPGLPLVNWSKSYGDLRVAHFLGMHALQLIPLVAFFLNTNKTGVYIISILYFLFVTFTLIQALAGKPFIK